MKVVLEPVAPRVLVDYIEHLDALVHEFRIVASGQESGVAPVRSRAFEVVNQVLSNYGTVKDEAYLAARRALEHGEQSTRLELDLPPEAAAAADDLLRAIEEADVLARQEGLLTLPASPEVLAFARWALPELATQLRTGGPR